ncbi:MAG: hypothetical protein HFG26_02035 [Provencibacterium sp.]|jgi:hypothetical protein|nr:hypothetical protein [Provencibacterium sp.]
MAKSRNPAVQISQQEKQYILEQLWLSYYNDTLYEKGLITENECNRMRIRIQNRTAVSGQ